MRFQFIVLLLLLTGCVQTVIEAPIRDTPEKDIPVEDKCTLNPPFVCMEYEATKNSLDMTVHNGAGVDVELTSILMECGFDVYSLEVGSLAMNERRELSWADVSCVVDGRFFGSFVLTYKMPGDQYPRTSSGRISAPLSE